MRARDCRWSGGAAALGAALLVCLAMISPASAQTQKSYSSYVTPFPPAEHYRLLVLGDSLAAGLARPLTADLAPQSIEVVNKTAAGLGLARNDGNDWDKAIDALPASETYQIAVIQFGADDRQPIRTPKRWLGPGTPEWQQEYSRRVDALLKSLHSRNVAVYWLGLPIMRGPLANAAAQAGNSTFVERVRLGGAKFIDSWEGFADADGAYTDTGPDITGNVKQMRLQDGIHLTIAGYQKLANFAEREITHDLTVAKRERDVPLAGDEAEQKSVRDDSVPRAGGSAVLTKSAKSSRAVKDVPADDGTVDAMGPDGAPANIAIMRPPIPGAIIQQAQSIRAAATQAELGHTLPADLKGGFTVLSSVATSPDTTGNGLKSQLPLTQNPFYKLLILGDSLPAKPGRVDDFSWPKAGG
jgi:uncharacterized protein